MTMHHTPNGITAILADVRAFHEAGSVPSHTSPQLPPKERVELRADLHEEEFAELHKAMGQGDLVGVADGIADLIYVLVGTALEYGIPLDRVWAEVQRSNMAKVDPATGTIRRRADGKILKPLGWSPPDIASAIGLKTTEPA